MNLHITIFISYQIEMSLIRQIKLFFYLFNLKNYRKQLSLSIGKKLIGLTLMCGCQVLTVITCMENVYTNI